MLLHRISQGTEVPVADLISAITSPPAGGLAELPRRDVSRSSFELAQRRPDLRATCHLDAHNDRESLGQPPPPPIDYPARGILCDLASSAEPAGLLQVSADVDPDCTEVSELTYHHGVAVTETRSRSIPRAFETRCAATG
ncbi:hypothetical protein GCM10017690_17460 [Microbacterium terregens]